MGYEKVKGNGVGVVDGDMVPVEIKGSSSLITSWCQGFLVDLWF